VVLGDDDVLLSQAEVAMLLGKTRSVAVRLRALGFLSNAPTKREIRTLREAFSFSFELKNLALIEGNPISSRKLNGAGADRIDAGATSLWQRPTYPLSTGRVDSIGTAN
jgi:hypothetical protein